MNVIPESDSIRFPIVGVVASAGGLDAFKELLSSVPADCGMAFVLVPHLDPTYDSQMVPILSKVSLISVVKATQGMVVEPDHAYVIPSNFFLTIADGVLQLTTPTTPQGHAPNTRILSTCPGQCGNVSRQLNPPACLDVGWICSGYPKSQLRNDERFRPRH